MNTQFLLGSALTIYLVVMFAISIYARGRVSSVEDFVVAGRRLPLWMASATLLATWFGAGPVLTASTEVANHGLHKAALDPIGAGLCLVIAGLFFATKLWKMGILTVCDFFRETYGTKAEILSAIILIPSYFGWIAAQFVALANVLNYIFGVPVIVAITAIAIVGTLYTVIGGMWSVTLTDTVQIFLVVLGLVVLSYQVLSTIGSGDLNTGISNLTSNLEKEKLAPFHSDKQGGLFMWISIVLAGALGNIPGQDLMQRVFSANSAKTAKLACIYSGIAYLILGSMTVGLGLCASYFIKEPHIVSALPALSKAVLSPVAITIFMLAIVSCVLSTIDSAILAPATVLAQNLLSKIRQEKFSQLTLNRLSIILIAAMSYCLAISGEGAYGLLEDAYSLTMAGLFVPLSMGLWSKWKVEAACIYSMLTGFSIWLLHTILGWQFFLQPVDLVSQFRLSPSLIATLLAGLVFVLTAKFKARSLA